MFFAKEKKDEGNKEEAKEEKKEEEKKEEPPPEIVLKVDMHSLDFRIVIISIQGCRTHT